MKYEFWRNKKLEFINNPSFNDTNIKLYPRMQ